MLIILFALLLVILPVSAFAQANQPCIVKQYNQKSAKTPLSGVELIVSNAGSQVSDDKGLLTLHFRTLKPGDRITLVSAKKNGYEVMNTEVVGQWVVSRDEKPLELVMVSSAYFAELKSRLKRVSSDSYKLKYEKAVRELEAQKEIGTLKEAEYNKRYDELESRYMDQMNNLDKYVDEFARIDLSIVSEEEQRILEMVENGRIEEAIKEYEKLDLGGRLREARQNKKILSGISSRLKVEEERQDSIITVLEKQ